MTLEELRSICAQIASNYMVLATAFEDVGVEVACESIVEAIQAIPLPAEQSRKDFANSDEEGCFKDLISQFRKAAWERDTDEMLRIQKFIFDLVKNELAEPAKSTIKESLTVAKAEQEPIAWIYEDELPNNYPYDEMFKYSKVDVVRIFPVYAPSPSVATLEKQIEDLKESLLFALQELDGEVSHNPQDYLQKYDLARERAK